MGIKIYYEKDENQKQEVKEEEEVDMDKIKRKMIKNINKIIKKLNKHFIKYINDKTIKYENEILEKHLNRKYSNALEKFENIESKVILRREEKALKDKEKEYDKVNTMLNIHQIKNSKTTRKTTKIRKCTCRKTRARKIT